MTNICELCGAEQTFPHCHKCASMPKQDLIEAAHKTIRDWKRIATAATMAHYFSTGRSIVLGPSTMLRAQDTPLTIEFTPLGNCKLSVEGIALPAPAPESHK